MNAQRGESERIRLNQPRLSPEHGRLRLLVATAMLLISFVLAGCASDEGPSSTGTSSPTSTPTTVPTASGLCAHEFTGCKIAAGTYSTAPFDHPFTFTIETEWENTRAWPDGGEIAPTPQVGAFQWGSGVAKGNVEGKVVPIGPKPADLIAHLRKFEGFNVGQPSPATIGGVLGQQLDVLTNETKAQAFLLSEKDAFNVAPGEKLRFFIFDRSGETVFLIVDAFKEADFDSFSAIVQPILDSIVWK